MKKASHSWRLAKLADSKCWRMCLFWICNHPLYSLNSTALSKPAIIQISTWQIPKIWLERPQNKKAKGLEAPSRRFSDKSGLFLAILCIVCRHFTHVLPHNAGTISCINKKTGFFKRRLFADLSAESSMHIMKYLNATILWISKLRKSF